MLILPVVLMMIDTKIYTLDTIMNCSFIQSTKILVAVLKINMICFSIHATAITRFKCKDIFVRMEYRIVCIYFVCTWSTFFNCFHFTNDVYKECNICGIFHDVRSYGCCAFS